MLKRSARAAALWVSLGAVSWSILPVGALVWPVLSLGCSRGNDAGSSSDGPSAAGSGTAADPAARPTAVSPPAGAANAPATEPPQLILLLSLDTLRADHLGLYGYERPTSPVLDDLAKRGVVFDDASSPTPWTLPAHASLLTGLYPLRHGVTTRYTRLAKRISTLTGWLQKQGYETAAVVNSDWLAKKPYHLTKKFHKYLFVQPMASRAAPSTWITDQAIEWIKGMGTKRLFLFVHYNDIHSDYASLPEFEKLFASRYEGPANGTAWQLQLAGLSAAHLALCSRDFDETRPNNDREALCTFGGDPETYVIDENTKKVEFDSSDFQHLTDLYDAGIRQLDTELGRLFAYLDENGILDKTLFVVLSDHGESLGEHGEVEHYITTYQEVLRVPLIIGGPGIPKNRRVAAPVSLVDVAPTILRIAHAPLPEALDGIDLSPLWGGGSTRDFDRRLLHGEAAGGVSWSVAAPDIYPVYRSIRRGSHKLIYDSDGERYALFDLAEDPGELRDIAAQEPALVAELEREMNDRYRNFSAKPSADTAVEIDREGLERLRALGYIQ